MDNLNYLLDEFNKITDRILSELSIEEYDKVNLSLRSREEIINKINSLEYDKNEFKRLSVSLNLPEKELKVSKELKGRMEEKRDALGKISKAKYANEEYKKAYSADSIFINKKI